MKKITLSFVALSHLLATSLFAGSTSFTLSGSALTIDPSVVTIPGSGGDTGKTGSGGSTDTSKLASGGSTGGTTFFAAPTTDTIFTPPPVITTIDPSVLTTVLATGGSGGGSGGSSVEATGGAPAPISVLTADAPPTTDTAKTSPSLLDTVITTISDITTTIIDTIIPPTTPTITDTTAKDTTPVTADPAPQTDTVKTTPDVTTTDTTTVNTTKDTTVVTTEPVTPTDTSKTTTTDTTTKDAGTVAPEPTLIDKVVDAVTTVIKDVVDLASSSPTANPSPFTPDYCFHLPFMDTCSACLSTKQVLEKVNDLNSDLINQGIDAYKYGYKLDWSLRSGKFITLNPDGSENTAVLSFNICEASSSEICELPIRNTVSTTEYPTYTLDNLLIFSFMHPEQANKTAAICSTLPNCAASLTTLSNGQYGLSMKISDVKKALCIEAYHGKILEISEKDPMLVTCLAEIPVCQPPVEETKIIEPAIPTTPTAEPTQPIAPTDPKVVEPTPTTQPADTKVVDTTTKPQPVDTTTTKTVEPVAVPTTTTEPTKTEPTPQITPEQPASICDTNPIDPSCFSCLTIAQAKESTEWINRLLATMPEPRPSPLTLSFDWNNNAGTITAPADHPKLTSYTFSMCDRPDAVCTSSNQITPDLSYISQNGINSLMMFSAINTYQAEKIISICQNMAKPAGSCTGDIVNDPSGVSYLRIKAFTQKDACLPVVGGDIISGPDSGGFVTCVYKKIICGIAAPTIETPSTLSDPNTAPALPTPKDQPTTQPTTNTDTSLPKTTESIAPAPTPAPTQTTTAPASEPSTPTTQIVQKDQPAPQTTHPETPVQPLTSPTVEPTKQDIPTQNTTPQTTQTETHPQPLVSPQVEPTKQDTHTENHPSTELPFGVIPVNKPAGHVTQETPSPATEPAQKKSAVVVIFCEEGSREGFYVNEKGEKVPTQLKSECPNTNISDNDQYINERQTMMDYIGNSEHKEQKEKIRKRIREKFDEVINHPEKKYDVSVLQEKSQENIEANSTPSQEVSKEKQAVQDNTQTAPHEDKSVFTHEEGKIDSVDGQTLKEELSKAYERTDDTTFTSKVAPEAQTFNDLLTSSKIGALSLSAPTALEVTNTTPTRAIIQPYPQALEMRGTGCSLIIK